MSNKINTSEDHYLYRLRPIEKLLKYGELEKQEFYFASEDKLNDPMEGVKFIIWQGDKILWKNLLKHYIACFSNILTKYQFKQYNTLNKLTTFGEILDSLNNIQINISDFNYKLNNPNKYHKFLFNKFLSNEFILKYLTYHENNPSLPINESELYSHLFLLQPIAYLTILDVKNNSYKYKSLNKINFENIKKEDNIIFKITDNMESEYSQIINKKEIKLTIKNNKLDEVNKLQDNLLLFYDELIELFDGVKPIFDNSSLINSISAVLESNFQESSNISKRFIETCFLKLSSNIQNDDYKFICTKFNDEYIRLLKRYMYSEWGVASFSGNCKHLAMWGYYAENHTGVALKFKVQKIQHKCSDKLSDNYTYKINLYNANDQYHQFQDRNFNKIEYANTFPKFNFFTNLGRLSTTIVQDWYNDNGIISIYEDIVFKNNQEWIEKHHNQFWNAITNKHTHWEHEDEYRLVEKFDFEDIKNRIRKFRFEDLDGVIFGINTSIQDKQKIIEIINSKSKNLFEKIQDYISSDNDLDYEARITLEEILYTTPNIIVKFGIPTKTFINELNNYKIHLAELCKNEEFKENINIKNNHKVKFYQAYYDEESGFINTELY